MHSELNCLLCFLFVCLFFKLQRTVNQASKLEQMSKVIYKLYCSFGLYISDRYNSSLSLRSAAEDYHG